jgi:SPX domain protein involved in polyphosphate accumulation
MSFRKELKSIIFENKINKLTKWINENNGKILYPERNINSIYLDNRTFSMYTDSLEGTVPRKKIRIRNYNSLPKFNKNNNKLELKISSVEGRFKTSKKSKNLDLSHFKINDINYGVCLPTICVSYKRIYYIVKDIRLTLDKKIIYRRIKFGKISNFYQNEPYSVIEIKYKNSSLDNSIRSFPFHFVRFSKYARAIELINKKYNSI